MNKSIYATMFVGLSIFPLNFDDGTNRLIKPSSAATVQLNLDKLVKEAEEELEEELD